MTNEARKVWEYAFGRETEGIDFSGKLIKKAAYGDENSWYGWNIDHVWPLEENGSDDFTNLQPVAIWTNQQKADKMNGSIKWEFEDSSEKTIFSVAKNIFYPTKKYSERNGIIKFENFYFYDSCLYQWDDNHEILYYAEIDLEKSDDGKICFENWYECDYDEENNCWKQHYRV